VTEKDHLTMPQLVTELAALDTKVMPASIPHWLIHQGYSFNRNAVGQRPFDKLRMRKDAAMCAKPASTGARSASRACARSHIVWCFASRPFGSP
jgi:hypothetical protein